MVKSCWRRPVGGQKDMIEMALCTRCGQHKDDYAEFCADCVAYLASSDPVGAYAGLRLQYQQGAAELREPEQTREAWPERQPALHPMHAADMPDSLPPAAHLGDAWPSPGAGISGPGPAIPPAHRARRPRIGSMPKASMHPPSNPHGGRRIAFAAAAAVLVIAIVTATVVVLAHHRGAGAAAQAGGRSPGTAPSRPGASSPAAAHSGAPASGDGVVTIAKAAAGSPHAGTVVSFLVRYFSAINSHDYRAYRRLFSYSIRGELTESTFILGYGSTHDSRAVLHNVDVIGPGKLEALVTFTSHQQPGSSPTGSSCTAWRITLYLTRLGHSYVLQPPPTGYQPSYRACS